MKGMNVKTDTLLLHNYTTENAYFQGRDVLFA